MRRPAMTHQTTVEVSALYGAYLQARNDAEFARARGDHSYDAAEQAAWDRYQAAANREERRQAGR